MNGINTESWRFVALTRLAPIVPFNTLNYALGVTEIPFHQYAIVTIVCIFPACIAYIYLFYLGAEAALAKEGLIQKALIGLFLLVQAIYSKRLLRLIRGRGKSNDFRWFCYMLNDYIKYRSLRVNPANMQQIFF